MIRLFSLVFFLFILCCSDIPVARLPNTRHLVYRNIDGLVHTLERRDGLALVLVKGVGDNTTVAQVDLAMGLLLEREGVLHPFLIVTLGEILARMGSARLLASGGRSGGLNAVKLLASSVANLTKDVTYAQVSRLRSSRVSTRSEFQIMLRSLMPTSGN